METNIHLLQYLAQFFSKPEMFQSNFAEKIKTRSLCSVHLFSENPAVNEIMPENIVERGRKQMTTWRLRIACWIPKTTNTHSKYVILIADSVEIPTRCSFVIEFIIPEFIEGSTYFERHTAHHQEL